MRKFCLLVLTVVFFSFTGSGVGAREFAETGKEAPKGLLSAEIIPSLKDWNAWRSLIFEVLEKEREEEFVAALKNLLQRNFSDEERVALEEPEWFALVDTLRFLEDCHRLRPLHPDTMEWLFRSADRLQMFSESLDRDDHWPEVAHILDRLIAHDPDGSERFDRLVMAMAVVWDESRRPPLHRQKGQALPYQRDLLRRYGFFRDLYADRGSRMPYDRLSVTALTFVVDTPVPVSELEWAQRNVRGTRTRWGDRYSAIRYDNARWPGGASGPVYNWPHGEYRLEKIERLGGICTDQGYYAVLTARANGIPAMIFTGMGVRGGHAWMGFMRDEDRWEMDVGRYEYDEYMIGHTINPQTNRRMSDHDVTLSTARSFRGGGVSESLARYRLGETLARLGESRGAYQSLRAVTRDLPLFWDAWKGKARLLRNHPDQSFLAGLYERQAQAYRNYPDQLFIVTQNQARLLAEAERFSEAAQLFRDFPGLVVRERQDLAENVLWERARFLRKAGEERRGRTLLERFLINHEELGMLLRGMVGRYAEYMLEIEEPRAGADFLGRFRTRLRIDDYGLERVLFDVEHSLRTEAGDQAGLRRMRR
ncbi:MAG: hypothetical protein JJT75_00900 [Opitutales bacterium]|nr:hypothetical protein [Opitutales bacterium]MCH8540274.1 hypothetical protein [Opitutales bacterium]